MSPLSPRSTSAMPPTHVPLALGSVLLLQLLSSTSAFFPNIWSLLAAPGSVTHQDLTEVAALNVTLQLFLERPPPGRPPLRLEDFLVSVPGSCHMPALPRRSWGLYSLRFCLSVPSSLPPAATAPRIPGPEIKSPSR